MNSFKEELQDLSDFVRRFAFWRTLLMIQIGCFMFGLVVSGILIPQNFFAGGLMGISLLILTLSGDWISLSLLYILLNLPLFLLGYRSFSLRFLVISLMGMGILSLNLEWTEGMNIPTREPLLAAILGGILSGAGSGLYLRFGGSVGGLDILGAFLKKKFSIPIGNTFILVNLVIIAANGMLFDLDIALYTGIFMYVFSWTLQCPGKDIHENAGVESDVEVEEHSVGGNDHQVDEDEGIADGNRKFFLEEGTEDVQTSHGSAETQVKPGSGSGKDSSQNRSKQRFPGRNVHAFRPFQVQAEDSHAHQGDDQKPQGETAVT